MRKMFQTNGSKILRDGEEFIIRGYNLGNWMMLERFMFGFPGVDQLFRRYLKFYGGQEKHDLFFDLYYKTYFQKKDAQFLKELGCNTLRIPFNYRVFEDDMRPFVFSGKAFTYMDRVIELCREQGIAVVIDFHAVQGYQAYGHCVDNITGNMQLYYDDQCQKRYAALWRFVAEHYKDNDNVIGYDIMNEPTPTPDAYEALRRCYRLAVEAIRSVDKTHIIFIEGTGASYDFSEMEERFDDNMAFSPHIYFMHPRFFESEDRAARRKLLIDEIDRQNEAAQRLNVPIWYGETGVSVGPVEKPRLDYLDISLEVFNERGYGWTIWTYKDLWRMGLVSTAEDCAWRKKTQRFIDLKKKYNLDVTMYGQWDHLQMFYDDLDQDFDHTPVDFGYQRSRADQVKDILWTNVINAIGQEFAPEYAKLFAQQPMEELERMVKSFDLDQCRVKQEWYDVIHRRIRE